MATPQKNDLRAQTSLNGGIIVDSLASDSGAIATMAELERQVAV